VVSWETTTALLAFGLASGCIHICPMS
jgi:hypothetical protein